MANFIPTVRRAKRFQVKASIMIEGLTGSGKTGLALCFAHALAGKDWEGVGMVDTENKSADLIVGQKSHLGPKFGEFLKIDLTEEEGFAPVNYIAAARALTEAGAKAVIFDSTTHAWNRSGGVLDLVNIAENDSKSKNKFAAWNTPEVTLNKNALFEMIRNSNYHVITTVRVKEKYGMEYNENNKTVIKSLGEQQIQSEGLKYEPDLVLSMVRAGNSEQPPVARVAKSRYPMLKLDEEYEFTETLIEQIRVFLEEGADPEELLKAQQLEYANAVKDYCGDNASRRNVWIMIKSENKYEKTDIMSIPLKDLKAMYLQLTAEGGK